MTYFKSRSGREVFLNLDRIERQYDDGGTPSFSDEEENALRVIRSLAPNQPVQAEHLIAADVIYDESVYLSPYTIFALPLHRNICKHFNEISDFGWDLRESLDKAGAFSFLDKVASRTTSQAIIERILAVFTVSSGGFDNISAAPPEYFHAVVDFFRSEDGSGWNREVLGAGDVTIQCISNVVRGLAVILKDDALIHKARKYRGSQNKQDKNWHLFQYSQHSVDRELLQYFEEFRVSSRMRPGLAQMAVLEMARWIKERYPEQSVRSIAHSPHRPSTLEEFLKENKGNRTAKTLLNAMDAARKFSVSICQQIAERDGNTAVFDLVSTKELQKLKKQVKKSPKPKSTRSRLLPEKLVPIILEILEEGESGWPGKRFRINVRTKKGTENIYCPVIPTLFRVMLKMPMRMGQIRRLDSGEGDVVHFNGDLMAWEKNSGPLAGYWADRAQQPRDGFPTKGYAIEIEDEIKPVTGIFANTNKTNEPHAIPWHIPELFQMLWDLRKWQEKYNPVIEPIGPEVYLDAPGKYTDEAKAEMPLILPIARLFPTGNKPFPGRIATSGEVDHAWAAILYEAEQRWNIRHPGNQAQFVTLNKKTKQPQTPRYNIHGIRVRGLTDLRRGGMPLDLLSKFIAGHATLLMTVYYTKPHASEIAEAVEAAAARSKIQRKWIDDLKRMEIDEALKRTVSTSPTAVKEAISSKSQFQFCNVAIGVCPYDGSRCHDGGSRIRTDDKGSVSKNIYLPVEPRNCVMCRHFISGPPFLNELEDYGTKLCERRQHLAREEERLNLSAFRYEDARLSGEIDVEAYENALEELGADIQKARNEYELVESSIYRVEVLLNASVKLIESDAAQGAGLMLVARDEGAVEYKETSEFHQAVRITQAGQVHTILGDERVQGKLSDYMNLIMFNAAVIPPKLFTKITPQHRQRAIEQAALFVAERTSRRQAEELLEGTITLKDLGIREQVQKLIDTTLSEPIPLSLAMPSRRMAVLEVA